MTKIIRKPITDRLKWPSEFKYPGSNVRSKTHGLASMNSAYLSGRKYMQRICHMEQPTHGIDFITLKNSDGWYWLPAALALGSEMREFDAGRKNKPFSFSKKDKPVTPLNSVTAMPPFPIVAQPVGPGPVAQPTREQRVVIRDELDRLYDIDKARYTTDWSDKKLAEKLDVPRIWVANIRADFFGDNDTNEKAIADTTKLDAGIAEAEAASARLLEMAQEAEKLASDLKALRAKLAPPPRL